ncbi:CRISPR-associated endodeoxyribonuclease NucC [Motilimonas cestriensis]|uniref:CRISPR-associated endodeoxyribonuclease NucC n=1 Tax=Motilimonas cestriensis TaxID=2742685 RepID=UPI003DA49DD1
MSQNWQLPELLENLHSDVQHKLSTVRKSFKHSVVKGDGAENVWVDLFNQYLPERYRASRAFIVDSKNKFSEQIDVVIYDRQYSPFIFHYAEQLIIPVESVYAVFEVKQAIKKEYIEAARQKVASVRCLNVTSLPIPHAGGIHPAKPPLAIIGGLLALENKLKKPITLESHLEQQKDDAGFLDIGCAADSCFFFHDKTSHKMVIKQHSKATTAFLFELLAQLQNCATVPMIDIRAYGEWLN